MPPVKHAAGPKRVEVKTKAILEAATDLFVKHGFHGTSMDTLSKALGVTKPFLYYYFKDKADILATVRAQAFSQFADTLEAAAAKGERPLDKARLVGGAYLRFAEEHPHAYRIMFEIDQPISDEHPELLRESLRARTFVTQQAEDMVKAGLIDADPQLFGWSMWAAAHGLVMLKQAGMLDHGPDIGALAGFHGTLMFKGALAASKKTGKKQ